jgi:hypothetical protein
MRKLAIGIFLIVLPITFVQAANKAKNFITLQLDFDWSANPDMKARADRLVESGLMPKAMVFADGKPLGLMPGIVKLPISNLKTRIQIGLAQFVERPLYSFEFDLAKGPPKSVAVTYPALSLSKDAYYAFDTLVLMRQLVESKVSVSHSDKEVYRINLPSAPYATLVGLAAGGPRFGVVKTIGVSHFDPKLGLQPPPWKSKRFASTNFHMPLDQNTKLKLEQSYPGIDVNWLERSYIPPYPKSEALRLETQPSGATIFAAGIKQDRPTTYTVHIPRSYWDSIELSLEGHGQCLVRTDWIEPASAPDKPYRFCCELETNSRCKQSKTILQH